MAITKSKLHYIQGLAEELKKINQQLSFFNNKLSPGKYQTLQKQHSALTEKIKHQLTKVHKSAHKEVHIVIYQSTFKGHTRYFEQVMPLTKEGIEIYFEIGNLVSPVEVKVLEIKPLSNSPKEIKKYGQTK